jgi:hypothetical protein
MMVRYLGSEFEIPDVLIDKFVKDFDGLAGSGQRSSVLELRESSEEVLDFISEEPEMLHEKIYLNDFIKALAIRQALQYHGVLYDA